MAAGISQPGGAGTNIMIQDDASTAGGRSAGPYTFAQISAAFPTDFVDVTVNASRKKYKSNVNLQWGDDTSIVCTTNGTTLLTSAGLFGPLVTGQYISGPGIAGGAVSPAVPTVTITKIDNSNITLSQAASDSSTAARVFFTARATTTLQETKSDLDFAAGKGFTNGGFQVPCPWHINLGTRIDAGGKVGWKDGCNVALGASFNTAYQLELYDSDLRMVQTGVLSLTGADDPTDVQRIVGCRLQNATTGVQPSQLGATGGGNLDELMDCLFSYDTTGQCISNISLDRGERCVICCAAPTAFGRIGGSGVAIKDFRFVGSPTTADFIWTSAGAAGWIFVRPVWSQSGRPKFSAAGSDVPLNGATVEYWLYGVTVIDTGGNVVAGIPIRLTDNFGNIVVDVVTNSQGDLSFNAFSVGAVGYTIGGNAVPVMDHYSASGVYVQRHRSPFTVQVNATGAVNPAYDPQTFTLRWPGYTTITTTAGIFEDVADVIVLQPAGSGGLASLRADQVIEADTARLIVAPAPQIQ